MVADKARAIVRRAEEGAIRGLPRVRLDPHWHLDPQPIETIREELGAAIADFFNSPGDVRVLAAPPGSGKTESVIEAARATGKKVDIFVPTMKLADEIAEKLDGRATVLRGRGQGDPVQPGLKMCRRSDDAEAVGKAGLSIQKYLCRGCSLQAACGYQAQFCNVGSIRVMAHNYLSLPPRKGLPKADLAVIDEGFYDSAIKIGTIPVATLSLIAPLSLGTAIRQGLERGDLLDTLRSNGFAPDYLRKAAKGLWARGKPKLDATLTGDALRVALPRGTSHVARLATLLLWLASEMAAVPRGATQIAWLDGDALAFSFPKPLHRLEGVPVLVIDAQADPVILRPIFAGRRLAFTRWDGVRNAHVIQVPTHSYSGTYLARDADRIGEVADLARLAPGTTALFTTKPARCQLTGEAEGGGTLPVPKVLADGVWVGNFGQLRGINDFAEADAVVVVGRSQLPASAAEAFRGLWWADPVPLRLPGEYTREDRGYCHPSRRGASVWVHPDARIQAIVEQRREWEIVQAIDRLRLFRPGVPRTVLVFGDLPLPVPVSTFAEASEVLPHEAVRIALKAGGVFIATPSWLCKAAPGRFSKPKGAKDWLRRSEWQKGAFPLRGHSLLKQSECALLPNPTALRFRPKTRRADRSRQPIDGLFVCHPLKALSTITKTLGRFIEVGFSLDDMRVTGEAHPDGTVHLDLSDAEGVVGQVTTGLTPDELAAAQEAGERLKRRQVSFREKLYDNDCTMTGATSAQRDVLAQDDECPDAPPRGVDDGRGERCREWSIAPSSRRVLSDDASCLDAEQEGLWQA